MNSVDIGTFKWRGLVDVSLTVVLFLSVFTRNLTAASNPLQEGSLLCGVEFCGKGRCENVKEFPFVECNCDDGWINFNKDPHLPCVLPNCTVDFHCGNGSPSPAPPPLFQIQLPNLTDPCSIDVCGPSGRCKSEGSNRKCQCFDGAANLLGDPKLPCIKKCNLGEDCKGVNVGFREAPAPFGPPPLANSVSPTDEGSFLCGVAFCGEGNCEDAKEFPFVKCNCYDGWINFNNDPHLPCVLPNCTVDFHCGNGSPSPPPPQFQFQPPNLTDPCWIDLCGSEGRCESEGSDRKCQCYDGAANLFGNPKLPCFKKCQLGADCNGLGFGFNQPPPAPPPPTNSVSPTNGDILNGLSKLYMLSVTVLAGLVLSI